MAAGFSWFRRRLTPDLGEVAPQVASRLLLVQPLRAVLGAVRRVAARVARAERALDQPQREGRRESRALRALRGGGGGGGTAGPPRGTLAVSDFEK